MDDAVYVRDAVRSLPRQAAAARIAGGKAWRLVDCGLYRAFAAICARRRGQNHRATQCPPQEIAGRPLEEVAERLDFLLAVGLSYLSLDRSAATLSGGEAQRIRLATQIGSRLRGVLYVLDEPSI